MSLNPLICILAGSVTCAGVKATSPDPSSNNYADIPERNAFGLKPPPQHIKENPPPQLPKIVLTGITTILDDKRALMKTLPPAQKPGDQSKELSLILTEGQREGEIEVLQIDEKTGSVKVNNSGTVMTLTLEKDGAKLPTTPPAPSAPVGMASAVPGASPTLTNQSGLASGLTNAPGMHPLPTRNFRMPPTRQVTTPTPVPYEAAVPQPPVGGVPTPTGVAPAPAVVSQPSDLTPEEQAILQQIQREVASPVAPVVSNVPLPAAPANVQPLLP